MTGQWLDEVRYLAHPLTGERLLPIGYTSRGPIWPVLGASEAAPEQPAGEDEDAEDAGGSADSDADDGDQGSAEDDADSKDEGQSPRIQELSRENARRRTENKELRTKLDEALKSLRQFQDKDKTELQRATEQASTFEAELNTLRDEVRTLRLGNAFLSANTYTWHDPDLALSQVDKDLLELDDDGTPTKASLQKALQDLAKKRPYLVKQQVTGSSGEPGPAKSRNDQRDEKKRQKELAARGLTGSFRR